MNETDIPLRNPQFACKEMNRRLVLCHPPCLEGVRMNNMSASTGQLYEAQSSIEHDVALLTKGQPDAETMMGGVQRIIRYLAEHGAEDLRVP